MGLTRFEALVRCLDETIAAGKSFERQLGHLAKDGNGEAAALFAEHARETREQVEALTARLAVLGKSSAAEKALVAEMLCSGEGGLILAYAMENVGVGMYEVMALLAEGVYDVETAELAGRLQSQEQLMAERVLGPIRVKARERYERLEDDALVGCFQEVEAAERSLAEGFLGMSETEEAGEARVELARMALRSRQQLRMLRERLDELEVEVGSGESWLAEWFKVPAEGSRADRLLVTYGAMAAGLGMYVDLAAMAEAAGDEGTEELARELEREKREDQEALWGLLQRSTRAGLAPE